MPTSFHHCDDALLEKCEKMLMDEIKEKLLGADPFASWWPFIVAGAVFLVTTIKAYMNGQYCPNGNLITDQVVVVTGGDGGIGAEIVKELAKRAAIVVMCCRSVEHGEKVRVRIQKFLGAKTRVRIDIRQLDLRSFQNIRDFVKAFGELYCACIVELKSRLKDDIKFFQYLALFQRTTIANATCSLIMRESHFIRSLKHPTVMRRICKSTIWVTLCSLTCCCQC